MFARVCAVLGIFVNFCEKMVSCTGDYMDFTEIAGVRDIADRYDAFFLDMCGVIMVGLCGAPIAHVCGEIMSPAKILDGAGECLSFLKRANKKVAMVTNADESRDYIIKLLRDVCGLANVEELLDEVITAGDMVESSLRHWGLKRGAKAFVWGAYPMRGVLRFFKPVETYQEADVVVCCEAVEASSFKHFEMDQKHKDILAFMLEHGIPMLAPNDDLVAPSVEGKIQIVAGFFAQAYRDMGGRALSTGKPGGSIFERAHAALQYPNKKATVMVGDTMETDILGAHNFGIDSLLIKSGNYSNRSDLLVHDMPLEVRPNWLTERFVW